MVLKEDNEFAINGKQNDSVLEETSVVSGTMKISVPKPTPKTAPPFEPPTQREIERQERCARGDAWSGQEYLKKLKEKDRATFFSPTNEWCLPAPSVIKPEER